MKFIIELSIGALFLICAIVCGNDFTEMQKRISHLESVTFGSSRCLK